MKKSELKKKWYYRLWQVLTLLLLLVAIFIDILILDLDSPEWSNLCADYYYYNDHLGKWVQNDITCMIGNIKHLFVYLLIPLTTFVFSWLVFKAIVYVVFGKLEK